MEGFEKIIYEYRYAVNGLLVFLIMYYIGALAALQNSKEEQ